MKKIIKVVLAAVMILSLTACGASSASTEVTQQPSNESAAEVAESKPDDSTQADEEVVLSLFAGPWREVPDSLDHLIAAYCEENPNVTIEYSFDDDALQANMAAGNYPDLLVTTAYSNVSTFEEYLLPLEDEPYWDGIQESTYEAVTADGHKYLVPLNYEGYGLVYNKKLFAEAGFNEPPKTLSEFKTLCENLQANGVTPLGLGFKEAWILKQSLLFPFHDSLDLKEVTDKLISGEITLNDTEFFKQYKDFYDVWLANCDEKSLDTDYTMQCTLFGAGEVAMICNGDWVAGMIEEIDPDLEMGLMGLPYSDNEEDYNIYTSVSNAIGIMKVGKNVDEAKKFINWLVASDSGIDWLAHDWSVPSPIKAVDGDVSVLASDFLAAENAGFTKSWGDSYFPGNVSSGDVQVLGQKYIMGEITWEEMCDSISKIIQEGAE